MRTKRNQMPVINSHLWITIDHMLDPEVNDWHSFLFLVTLLAWFLRNEKTVIQANSVTRKRESEDARWTRRTAIADE